MLALELIYFGVRKKPDKGFRRGRGPWRVRLATSGNRQLLETMMMERIASGARPSELEIVEIDDLSPARQPPTLPKVPKGQYSLFNPN